MEMLEQGKHINVHVLCIICILLCVQQVLITLFHIYVCLSDPYSDTVRPGPAAVKKIERAPVSGTFDPNSPPEVSAEYKPLLDDLIAWVTALPVTEMSGSERKQMAEIEKGTAVFSKRLARNEIDPGIVGKIGHMLSAMGKRDYHTASGIHTGLVNSDWKEHKDWLKGIKILIQLAAKKL